MSLPPPRLRFYPGPAVCWPLAIFFTLTSVWAWTTGRFEMSPGFWKFWAANAGLYWFAAIYTTIRRQRLRITMSLRELGVILNQHEIRYADIESITISDFIRGDERRNAVALMRTITIHAGKRIRTDYVAMPQDDPLDPLLDHLVERIAREPRRRDGRGWSIEGAMLQAGNERVPLSSIASAGVFDKQVRLWRRGDDFPFFSVPFSSRNARVLLRLASHHIAHATLSTPHETTGIGRLLFTRRTSLFSQLFLTALLFGALWAVQRYAQLHAPELHDLARGAAFGGALLVVFRALYRLTTRFDFYERAVVRKTLLGTRTLLYRDIRDVKWKQSVTLIEHAFYAGTSVRASFLPADGSSPMKLRLYRFRGEDRDLEQVREVIGRRANATGSS